MQRSPSHYKEPSAEKQLEQIQRRKYHVKKANIKRTGQVFDCPFSSITWPSTCPILGLALDYFAETRSETSPAFDRYDRTEGWTRENTFVCSWRAARLRADGSYWEHRDIYLFFSPISKPKT